MRKTFLFCEDNLRQCELAYREYLMRLNYFHVLRKILSTSELTIPLLLQVSSLKFIIHGSRI